MEPIKFKLSTPIVTHKGEVNELELKAPTARAFLSYGMPFNTLTRTDPETGEQWQDIRLNPTAMFGFISDMTGFDRVVLESLNGIDVVPLFGEVMAIVGNR